MYFYDGKFWVMIYTKATILAIGEATVLQYVIQGERITNDEV